MRGKCLLAPSLSLLASPLVNAQPYDFSEAVALLEASRPDLDGHVAVIVRQDGTEL
jgi:hypothetical protein